MTPKCHGAHAFEEIRMILSIPLIPLIPLSQVSQVSQMSPPSYANQKSHLPSDYLKILLFIL